ncbi:MAG: hypothetical protein ABW321_15570 [Polyangiales bacterium]
MHSSDETGDEPGRAAPSGGAATEPEAAGKSPHAFRERIRNASVAAAQVESVPEVPVATTSSVPPEHSGVRNRLGEGKQPPSPSASLSSRRLTPRAWPFAPSPRAENKRSLASTQVGLGTPVNPVLEASSRAAVGGETTEPSTASTASTLSTSDSAKAAASPGAYSVTPPAPLSTTEAPAWSPSSTKPQRAALLRSSEPAKAAGRYSVREGSVEFVAPQPLQATADATPHTTPQGLMPSAHDPATHHVNHERRDTPRIVPPPPAARAFRAEDEETTLRARRYTPKQRPTQRRGSRLHDRAAVANRSLTERESTRPVPDFATTSPGRPTAVRDSVDRARTPTQPKMRLPPNPIDIRDTRVSRLEAGRDAGQSQARSIRHEPSIVVDPVLAAPPPPPSAGTALVRYEPLPSDPVEYEQWRRSQPGAADFEDDPDTQMIARSSFAPPGGAHAGGLGKLLRWGAIAAAVALVAAGAAFLRARINTPRAAAPTTQLATSRSAAVHAGTAATTVIATEPSGAELLQSGAVLGNTPLEITRPVQGETLYVVRMHGFVTEIVRVSPTSSPALRLTLTPTGLSGSAGPQ